MFGTTITVLIIVILAAAIAIVGSSSPDNKHIIVKPWVNGTGLEKFKSDEDLVKAFKSASASEDRSHDGYTAPASAPASAQGSAPLSAPSAAASSSYAEAASGKVASAGDYSTTNIQVAGVDEADIVKTDGQYIYAVTGSNLVIVRAYPAADASIVSNTTYDNFTPQELFINGDRLLVFGSSYTNGYDSMDAGSTKTTSSYLCGASSMTSARLYDISDRSNPRLLKTVDVEGNYNTARMIGDYAYFVVDTYKYVYGESWTAGDIIPSYRENSGEFRPVANATDICYLPPVSSSSFTTVCSIDMAGGSSEKQTVAGSGSQVYVSQDNLYFARSDSMDCVPLSGDSSYDQNTIIVKLHLDQGKMQEVGSGIAPGYLLNQFSMDENDGCLRVATTRGSLFDTINKSTSNVYVFNDSMNLVGSLEGLAPGEEIYSTRFMGSRLYMVTFKKVDPLFVIDLSDPKNPSVLGKLKIPGYSDYLQPYDDTHIIGIGKDAVDASESEIADRNLDFAWYQGVKMAMFDVSDVEHPKELYKVVVGDRGTDSPVLYDHRALLFDKEKGLLVLPVTVAEIQGEKTSDNQYGDTVFDGVYVYHVDLDSGFTLRGNVTQYGPNETFSTYSGCYSGDRSIQRSLYIHDVLYTLSQSRLQLNDLNTLEKLKAVELPAYNAAEPVYDT
ncbi:MAG TPA: beta-propeller domain-containing protein [Methanocella sp.]|nr:beta-propeller domain-containing protein [Methanocella sp.]